MRNNVLRKGIILAIIVLFIGASVVPSTGMVEISNNDRDILYVGGSGPGNYTSIQDAIDNASNGDTVFVYNGTYHENVIINKDSLELLGENKTNTIIDGNNLGHGISIPIPSNYMTISNFTVRNANGSGIIFHDPVSGRNCKHNMITDCIVYNSSSNDDYNSGVGITLSGHDPNMENNLIINCETYNNDANGIRLLRSAYGVFIDNRIIGCKVYNNGFNSWWLGEISKAGLSFPYHYRYLQDTIISQCEIFNNAGDGIIHVGSATGTRITENSFYHNNGYGINITSDSDNSIIYHNNFVNNTQNANDECINTWYNATLHEGNYWDDYTGEDSDGDGIGDTPYSIPGGSNQDLYPLMYPWYPTHPETVYVDDDYDISTPGFGYDRFNRVQYGINEVEGSTVYVYNGTYYENVVIDKTINLVGEDRNSTIIDGGGSGDVVYVSADWVNITGFSMRNSGSSPFQDAGLDISSSSNCNVEDCLFFNNGYAGIQVFSASDCQLVKCHVYQNHEGMFIGDSNNIQILDCICNNTGNGIRVDSAGCWNVNIVNCTTYNNIGSGIIFIQGASNNNVVGCISYNNSYGISFYKSDTTNNNCFNCTIFENEVGIRCNISANNNVIYHNNFINNTQNAYDKCTNNWYNASIQEGNYWSDFNEPSEGAYDNNSDGIIDSPYDIPGDSNQDLYPLMHPFELYYILNISAPSDVYEDVGFLVIVKSIGGTAIPDAFVGFNNEIKRTNLYGQVYFRAPLVETDTFYNITATKDGYADDTETILVKDVPIEFVSTFIFGRIDNLTTGGDVITFEAVNIRVITLKIPPSYTPYTSGELITISKNPKGFVGALLGVQLIFAFCGLAYQPSTSTISMNKFSQDDFANTVIWLVSGVEGNPVETKDVEMILLNESGQPQPDAEITFNEVNVEGYINPGDTFTVVAPYDGYFVFMLTHKSSGATIYKSSLTHY